MSSPKRREWGASRSRWTAATSACSAGAGVVVILVGLAMAAGLLGWFGRLLGDIRIEREGLRVYIPLASMILVSIVLSVLIDLIRRFF